MAECTHSPVPGHLLKHNHRAEYTAQVFVVVVVCFAVVCAPFLVFVVEQSSYTNQVDTASAFSPTKFLLMEIN